jgi:hypothetical protein
VSGYIENQELIEKFINLLSEAEKHKKVEIIEKALFHLSCNIDELILGKEFPHSTIMELNLRGDI